MQVMSQTGDDSIFTQGDRYIIVITLVSIKTAECLIVEVLLLPNKELIECKHCYNDGCAMGSGRVGVGGGGGGWFKGMQVCYCLFKKRF